MLIVSGVPKIILQLDDLLGLARLRKAVILTGMIYYSERM